MVAGTRRSRGPKASPDAAPRRRGAAKPRGTAIEEAKALALRVLAFHARSEKQLRDRLARAGHASEVDDVVAWARRLGYLDDDAYARGRATALLARAGPRLAQRRLQAEGIDERRARAAVEAAAEERSKDRRAGDSPEVALCRVALRGRLRGADPATLDERARARVARFLLGRGFSGGAVSGVLGWDCDVEG